ncbi:O-acetyl-ADP-ribose deacetylase (regulator of RNase III), contains Macro domain [Ruminococcaceae bacterium YAD3003]|nr:O-acetyl-ADP-ribose deacetylase (regulator of RNase III), contains Macro domain [Ruminococcaceae bacterium YAD3003]
MAFKIVRNDITKITADAIVNTANPKPKFSSGTDSAVYAAAGADKLLEERKKIGRIEEGEVAVTPAFDLDAKYIFHTVGPIWKGGNYGEAETVKRCYTNCLNKALELELESIAFPLLATGNYGFPKSDALLLATSVFSNFLAENEMDITLVVFDNESFELSGKIFDGINQFINDNYVEEKINEEYFVCDEAASEPDENAGGRRSRKHGIGLFTGRGKRMAESTGMSAPLSAEAAAPEYKMAGSEMLRNNMAALPVKRSLEDVVKNVSETWSESLLRLITERGYTDTEVYKRANVDRKLFSKIRSNKDYQPKKNTAVAFALALRLNLDETKDFLRRAGYAFSPSSKFDLIIEYSIENGVYDLMLINSALFDHDQPQLGA